MRLHRFQLGRKQESRPGAPVVKRLFANAIAGKREPSILSIPDRQRKHTYAALQRGAQSPGLDGRKQRLGIRMAAPCSRALLVELRANRLVIVDLAVEDNLE